MKEESALPPAPADLVKITLIVAGLVVLFLMVWQLSHLLVLTFAAILFALILRSLANQIERFTPVKNPWSLLLAILFIAGVLAGFFWLLGMQIKAQFANLIQQIPQYIQALEERFDLHNLEAVIAERLQGVGGGGMLGTAASFTAGLAGALTSFVLILITGIYLAANPRLYFRGFMLLVPKGAARKLRAALENTGRALQLWLLGQLVSMVIVGTIITIGLSIIGLPSALALGFMAGIAEFIPILGPVLASIPAILIAVSEGDTVVFWVIGLYVLVQQLESYVIMPLVQRRAVHLPPVLLILSIVAFGTLFGLPGVLLGAPLTVVAMVMVDHLYVRETLGKDIDVPGEKT
jgi:predicted PurR-regulated permease PerM